MSGEKLDRAIARCGAPNVSLESMGRARYVVCEACRLTEDLETAEERWAQRWVDGRLVSWTCEECWSEQSQSGCCAWPRVADVREIGLS